MNDECIFIYVVYDHPLDWPDMYIVRKWLMAGLQLIPYAIPEIISKDLGEIRFHLYSLGLSCVGPEQGEDPKILEKWV